MERQILLVFISLWYESSATFVHNDFTYEDGFVADSNYDVHESSLNSQELQEQPTDAGSWISGTENSPHRVARDLLPQTYDHWSTDYSDENGKHSHVVKRDVSAVEEDLEESHLDSSIDKDAVMDTSTEDDHVDYNYYYEVPGSEWHQDDDSLEVNYELDSHEEPVEERTHGVQARQPRDDEEEPVEERTHGEQARQPRDDEEEPVEESTHGVQARQPRDDDEEAVEEADTEFASNQMDDITVDEKTNNMEDMELKDNEEMDEKYYSSQVTNKRDIRHTAMNYEKNLQSDIDDFYAEEGKKWSLIEKKKREITSALASEYHGYYTMEELESAVESALNEYYGQKIVNRLKRAAYMEQDFQKALRIENDYNKQNTIQEEEK